jgi:hypothetical protein
MWSTMVRSFGVVLVALKDLFLECFDEDQNCPGITMEPQEHNIQTQILYLKP